MLQISAEMLAMSGEYTVLEKNGKIAYLNSGAHFLLGSGCVGMPVAEVLGEDLAGVQAPTFIGEFVVKGKRHIVRVCTMDGMRAFFLSPVSDSPSLINTAFIYSLRACLMNLDLSLSLIYDKENLTPELDEQISSICHECFKINRVLSNISLIHDISEEKQLFSPIHMDLNDHIMDLVDSMQTLEGPEIKFNSPGSIPLYADPNMVDTLILNLVSNSMCHGKGCKRISISLTPLKERVIISVDDDGCGIPADTLHTVFDRYRHTMSLSELENGAGLGLTAVRLIAAMHDGILLLESRENIGTSVRVSLSYAPELAQPLKHPPQIYEKSMTTLLTGLAGCLPSKMYTAKYMD